MVVELGETVLETKTLVKPKSEYQTKLEPTAHVPDITVDFPWQIVAGFATKLVGLVGIGFTVTTTGIAAL